VSRAHELGIQRVALPTNGNAGAAWALYAARAGMRSLVAMPVSAPPIARAECSVAGAELYLVDGLIGDAGKLITAAVAERGGYQEVSTLKEPYRVEGKKTMGYEIAEQLDWKLPDVILCPTGGGVGLVGIWKALHEMTELGWIAGPFPRLVAVQAHGSDRACFRATSVRELTVPRHPHRRIRHQRAQGPRRLHRAPGRPGDGRHRDCGHGRRPPRRTAPHSRA
jgi:threonine synthase